MKLICFEHCRYRKNINGSSTNLKEISKISIYIPPPLIPSFVYKYLKSFCAKHTHSQFHLMFRRLNCLPVVSRLFFGWQVKLLVFKVSRFIFVTSWICLIISYFMRPSWSLGNGEASWCDIIWLLPLIFPTRNRAIIIIIIIIIIIYVYIYIYIYIYIYVVYSINFQTFFVRAFNIIGDSWKFTMLLLYILWDNWPIFIISDSN